MLAHVAGPAAFCFERCGERWGVRHTMATSILKAAMRRIFLIVLTFVVGCESESKHLTTNVPQRRSQRPEALGCWPLTFRATEADTLRTANRILVQLDTSRYGDRVVRRLDSLGNVLVRDVEGLSFSDRWIADSASDSIRIGFNNGLYGSVWVLALPADVRPTDTLCGQSQEFDDVEDSEHPITAALAIQNDLSSAC